MFRQNKSRCNNAETKSFTDPMCRGGLRCNSLQRNVGTLQWGHAVNEMATGQTHNTPPQCTDATTTIYTQQDQWSAVQHARTLKIAAAEGINGEARRIQRRQLQDPPGQEIKRQMDLWWQTMSEIPLMNSTCWHVRNIRTSSENSPLPSSFPISFVKAPVHVD